jgi:hypothetical protein
VALLLLRIFFWEGSLHHVLHSKLFNSKLKHRFTCLSYEVVKGRFLVFTSLLKLLQWAPLNGITVNWIIWLIGSNLTRFTGPILVFYT